MKTKHYAWAVITVVTALVGCASIPRIDRTPKPDAVRGKEIAALKWGMFVCWSFSTFSGKEWTPTRDKDASYFKATGCDTDQWCKTAKDAGMGYILFLTKHHDGFCLWDTKTTAKKVTNSPLKRDVLAELRKSCDKYGIKLALYFSEGDWNWPGAQDGVYRQGGSNPEIKKAQLKELLTQYGPIEYIWFDHAAGTGGLNHADTDKWVRQWQPNCFSGYNQGEAGGRISLREQGKAGPIGKAFTGNVEQGGNEQKFAYTIAEFTYPILPHHTGSGAEWFYSVPALDNSCRPAKDLYADYLGAVKYGNIFSLDVGPNYEGKLRDIDVRTLHEVGEMIRAAGDRQTPSVAQPDKQELQAAAALVGRVMGDRASAFTVESIPDASGKNVFEVESVNGKIVLRGDNGVSIASALNHYLKYSCQCDIAWCGKQMAFPKNLPPVAAKIRCVTPHKYRTFFNYCTFGYSMPWWGWPEWERAVDQLAMQGYNMPLAMTGMEGIWYHTLLRFGFTDLEARSFLSAPGHLPWQLMQNLEGAGGPLPKSWIDSHIELGRKIIERERELGMTPIQQGFSGHVPHLLKTKYPTASIAVQPSWCNFPGVAQLDPLDPLFETFGTAFIEEEIKLFGAGHLYAADPFHESAPPKPGNEYLTAVGKKVFSVMTKVDPKATWIMQGWTNHRPIVESVSKDKLLILSIPGAGNGAYWGYPFVNCRYNNFGCRNNLHGDLKALAANPFAATVKAPDSNCFGTGLMMEGVFQNPVFLQMNSDLIWRDGPVDVTGWLHDYARRRYGADSASANQAWDLLLAGPYASGSSVTEMSSIIAARPALNCKKSGPNEGFGISYPPQLLVQAWELLLKDSRRLKASDGYRFDVVDVTRQALSNLGQDLQKEVTLAHLSKDKLAFEKAIRAFLDLLDDVDSICGTRPEYHFGKWVADGRKWGATEAESDLLERDASMLVTLWGPANDPQIFDYAWREWSGLVKSYYRARWDMFFAYLAANPDYRDSGPQVYGREAFRANGFYQKLADWETAWTQQRHNLPPEPSGDTVAMSSKLLKKYKPLLEKVYAPGYQQKLAVDIGEASVGIPANAVKIGQWKSGEITPAGKELVLDVSKAVMDEGTYEVAFTYLSGWHRLDIEWVAIMLNGTEIMRDAHAGTAGTPSKDNVYKVNPGTMAFNSKYEIRARVKTHGANDSNGVITLRKSAK